MAYDALEPLLETWRINQVANEMLLEHAPDGALDATLSKRGGRTVAQQIAHVHDVRVGWLEGAAKDLAKDVPKLGRPDAANAELLREHLRLSHDAIAELIRRAVGNDGRVRGFARGIIPLVGYLLAHEAHHRGHALLTIKQSGHALPDTLRWGLWNWAKM